MWFLWILPRTGQTCFAPKWPQLQSLLPSLLILVGWSKARGYWLTFWNSILQSCFPPMEGRVSCGSYCRVYTHTCSVWDCTICFLISAAGQCIRHSVQGGLSLRDVRCGYFDLEGTWRSMFNLFLLFWRGKLNGWACRFQVLSPQLCLTACNVLLDVMLHARMCWHLWEISFPFFIIFLLTQNLFLSAEIRFLGFFLKYLDLWDFPIGPEI